MGDPTNAPMLPPPSGVSEWFTVWRDALTRPSDQTYARIGVNQFGWGQAMASMLSPVLAIACCFVVGAFAIAQTLGPQIMDIFKSITAPVP